MGLKKKGAITAIPLAPMAAACLAYERENRKIPEGTSAFFLFITHIVKRNRIIYAPGLGTLVDLVLPHE